MGDNISTRITNALINYIRETGEDMEEILEAFDLSPHNLVQSGRFVSNETLIILFAQARQLSGDENIALKAGRKVAGEILHSRLGQTIPINPESGSVAYVASQLIKKLCPLISVEVTVRSREEMQLVVKKKLEYLHTHDHCLLIKGIISGVIDFAGGTDENIGEVSCLVPVDRAGEIDGKLYRMDDDGRIWKRDAKEGPEEEEAAEGMSGTSAHTVAGTTYGSDRCVYKAAWKDPRGLLLRAWHKSVRRTLHFFRIIKIMEKSPVIDPESYEQVTQIWKGWLKWEPTYRLTKAKYLAYLGVICLGLLPVLGNYYDHIESHHYRTLLSVLLTGMILALGFLITKLQLDYARKIHRQHEDSQKFLQHAGVGVTIINSEYQIEYANPLVKETHGEIEGKKCYEAFVWDTEPCGECPLREVFGGANHSQMMTRYYNKDGQQRWYHINSTPLRDREEKVSSVINVSTDITDRKLLELELSRKQDELEASEERYRNFMANAADAILITDPQYNVLEANKESERLISSFDVEQLLGRNLFETHLLTEGEKSAVKELFEEMTTDMSPRSFETRLLRHDGTRIDVEARTIPIPAQGEVAWIQIILRDVTQRKQQEFEKSLLLSISNAIKDAPDLQAMIDQALEGICAVMNVPIGAIFLRSEENALKLAAQVGMSSNAIKKMATLAVDGSASDVASRTAIMRKPIVINNMEKIKASRQTRERIREMGICSMTSVPMLMEDELQGVVYIASREKDYFNSRRMGVINQVANELAVGTAKQKLRDVIQQKNKELVSKNQELEQASIQLLQSEKMASIGQLAAGVAHEINNPMGYVNSNLNLLSTYRKELAEVIEMYRNLCKELNNGADVSALKRAGEEIIEAEERVELDEMLTDLKDMISESIEGAERVTYIVKNLKEFSHPESGTPQRSDIKHALESTLNIVWNELKYKAEVIKEYEDLPMVPCYPQELKQVFMNILMNASQAIPEKGKIIIRTFQEEGWINVQIEDTGEGMPPEMVSKIFDPFYTSKEVGKGTGLGLSISYSIMQKHGGKIEVESTPGEGSVFTLKLPVSPEDQLNETEKKEEENELGSVSNY